MKVSIDGKEHFTLSDIQKKVIQNDIPEEIFESDMIRRLEWCYDHPCEMCYDQKKKQWYDVLNANGVSTVTTDKVKLADSVFEHISCVLHPESDQDMIISVDDKERFRISPTHKRMIKMIGIDDPDDYLIGRMNWILAHKYERCMERLRREWEPRLKVFPTSDEEFAHLVFSQPDYKNRSTREKESKNDPA